MEDDPAPEDPARVPAAGSPGPGRRLLDLTPRRRALSMDLAANRQAAWTALAGDTGPEPFSGDRSRAGHAADGLAG